VSSTGSSSPAPYSIQTGRQRSRWLRGLCVLAWEQPVLPSGALNCALVSNFLELFAILLLHAMPALATYFCFHPTQLAVEVSGQIMIHVLHYRS
jgi:hypothetical protein